MRVRQDLAKLLLAGATYAEIRQQLGGVSDTTIARARRALRIPVPHRTRPARTPEESYALYATAYGDGHARWDGPWAGRMPQIWHNGRGCSALRVAFRMRHGREPVGNVRPVCGEHACVASGHLADRPMRERLTATYEAIFGRTP